MAPPDGELFAKQGYYHVHLSPAHGLDYDPLGDINAMGT
jgi:hypothetical protein